MVVTVLKEVGSQTKKRREPVGLVAGGSRLGLGVKGDEGGGCCRSRRTGCRHSSTVNTPNLKSNNAVAVALGICFALWGGPGASLRTFYVEPDSVLHTLTLSMTWARHGLVRLIPS